MKKIILFLFLFYFSVYFLSASGKNFYNTDASKLRFQVVKSIVERSDITVPQGKGIKGADGRDYSWVGMGSALLAMPFYIVGKEIGGPMNSVSIMNQYFGAMNAVLVFLFVISLGYSRRAALLVSIFYGLGTMAWPLAKHPFDHTIETFFVLLSVYLTYQYVVKNRIIYLLLSALSFGFAFITRHTSILVVIPLFTLIIIYQIRKAGSRVIVRKLFKDAVLFLVVTIPFLCLCFWYNYSRFGSIFETGYQLMAKRLDIYIFTGTPMITGLGGLLLSPGKGFFYYSPVTIFFFFTIRSFIKRHSEIAVCFICMMLSYILFYSNYMFWHGDWAWGPRYIFVLTPFFIIPLAELFESKSWQKNYFRKAVICSFFIVSFIIQIAAVSVDFQKYFLQSSKEDKIQFTVISGEDAQGIIVPVAETYFDWDKSPILVHFKFIYKITQGIDDYRHSNPSKDMTLDGKIEEKLFMNVYDFWWLYSCFIGGSIRGFIIAIGLFIFALLLAVRLWKYSYEKP